MKKILLLICILALALPAPLSIYAQTGEEGLVTQQMRNFNQYYLSNMEVQKPTIITSDFLKTVNSEPNGYEDTPFDKGGVGTINALTAWTEIPKEIASTSEEYNILAGVTYGFGKGFISGMARGASGLYDMATCGIPPYDEPAMKPEYKVNKPQNGLKLTVFKW